MCLENGGRTTFCTNMLLKKENETYLDDNLKLSKTMSFENRVFKNDRQQSLLRTMKLESFDYS